MDGGGDEDVPIMARIRQVHVGVQKGRVFPIFAIATIIIKRPPGPTNKIYFAWASVRAPRKWGGGRARAGVVTVKFAITVLCHTEDRATIQRAVVFFGIRATASTIILTETRMRK